MITEIRLDQFKNSGCEYEFTRDVRGYFCIKKNGEMVYKGFDKKSSEKQYYDFKRSVTRGGENG